MLCLYYFNGTLIKIENIEWANVTLKIEKIKHNKEFVSISSRNIKVNIK